MENHKPLILMIYANENEIKQNHHLPLFNKHPQGTLKLNRNSILWKNCNISTLINVKKILCTTETYINPDHSCIFSKRLLWYGREREAEPFFMLWIGEIVLSWFRGNKIRREDIAKEGNWLPGYCHTGLWGLLFYFFSSTFLFCFTFCGFEGGMECVLVVRQAW